MRKGSKLQKTIVSVVCSLAMLIAGVSGTSLSPKKVYAETKTVSITGTYGQTEARTILSLVNEFRTGSETWAWKENDTEKEQYDNLGTLTYDYELEKIAMTRAAEIAMQFAHERPNGELCLSLYGTAYSNTWKGENIAVGQRSAEAVMESWKETNENYAGQGHRRNMLNSNFTTIGVGHFKFQGYDFWVQEFSSTNGQPNEVNADDGTETVPVEVNSSSMTKEDIAANDISMQVGETKDLPEASYELLLTHTWPNEPVIADKSKDWTVSNGDSVRIENGKLVGVSAGESKLSITIQGMTKDITVSVKEVEKPEVTKTPEVIKTSTRKVKCKKIFLNKKKVTMKKGKSFQLKVKLSPKKCTEKVKYSVSGKKILSVSAKGKVRAKKKGKAWVFVTVGSKKEKCRITVK